MIDQASNPPRLSATLLGLGRARPLQFFISSGSVFSHYLLQLAPGLLLQAFFDDLTGRQPARLGPYTLLALLAGVAIMAGIQGIANTAEPTLRQAAAVLMRRNLLAAILRRPAAQALPGSPGAVSATWCRAARPGFGLRPPAGCWRSPSTMSTATTRPPAIAAYWMAR